MKNRIINSQQNKWLRKSIYYEKELGRIDRIQLKTGEDDIRKTNMYGMYLDNYYLMMFYYKLSLREDDFEQLEKF